MKSVAETLKNLNYLCHYHCQHWSRWPAWTGGFRTARTRARGARGARGTHPDDIAEQLQDCHLFPLLTCTACGAPGDHSHDKLPIQHPASQLQDCQPMRMTQAPPTTFTKLADSTPLKSASIKSR